MHRPKPFVCLFVLLGFFLASTKLKILFCLSFFSQSKDFRASVNANIYHISNWQGCGKNFLIPLPTKLWGTTYIYMTLNYHYSSPASCHSLMQGEKTLLCVKFHIVSGPLHPALTSLISESKLSELCQWLRCQLNHSPYLYVKTSFQGLPGNCKGVATSLHVPSGPRFTAISKTCLKGMCQTLTTQSLFQEKDFQHDWRWAPWVVSS